jgi:hypothetical protein
MKSLQHISRFGKEALDIILHADFQLAGLMLGLSMVMWGCISTFVAPNDIAWFAQDFIFQSTVFWFINHTGAGILWIYASVKKYPHPLSMLLGSWCAMMWTFVQVSRPTSTYTSGMTLNFVVIAMGILLVYRSGKNG